VKLTIYVWPAHLEEFLKHTARRKTKESLLLAFKYADSTKVPITMTWVKPETPKVRNAK